MKTCTICGGKSLSTRYRNVAGGHMLLECKSCGIQALSPLPSKEEREAIYQDYYYDRWGYGENTVASIKLIKECLYKKILDEVSLYAKNGKILDVGCAMGFSLDVAKERGFEPYGVEISEFAGKLAKAKYGDSVKICDIEKADFGNSYFDVITLVDILEHIKDPVMILKKLEGLLKEGGILAVVTPDTASLSARIMGRTWLHIKKEHILYFSPKSISFALTRAGFNVETIKPFPKPVTVLYATNIIKCSNFNFLYDILKIISSVLPRFSKMRIFNIFMGESIVIARRGHEH